jgi:hypothetical protein
LPSNRSARGAFVVALPQSHVAGKRQCVMAPVCRPPGEPNRGTLSPSAVATPTEKASMTTTTHSVKELEMLVGVPARTLRRWIKQAAIQSRRGSVPFAPCFGRIISAGALHAISVRRRASSGGHTSARGRSVRDRKAGSSNLPAPTKTETEKKKSPRQPECRGLFRFVGLLVDGRASRRAAAQPSASRTTSAATRGSARERPRTRETAASMS